ncbi:unnamed protein product [Arabis nemorensis]|uniref:DUF4283 domain-containing protein n=1 Tax=Arabis nemorensis TaxID=586526 RepID=A0A565BA73_9BRAS|nr:unnamed protein product [Arabis nemorensis]
MLSSPLLPPPRLPPDTARSSPSSSHPLLPLSLNGVEMPDLVSSPLIGSDSAPLFPKSVLEKGVLGKDPPPSSASSSLLAPVLKGQAISSSALHKTSRIGVSSSKSGKTSSSSSLPHGSSPTKASPVASSIPKVSSTGFNWTENINPSFRIPDSTVPVTVSPDGRPRVKVPNVVFERGAKIHSDYIVGIFYGNAPSYGKVWGVLNFLWGKDKKVTVHSLTSNAFLFHISSAALHRRVLQHELWRVGDSPFFVTEWKASYSLNPPSLERAPIWATTQYIPFDLVTEEGMSYIAKPLGKVVDAKPFTSINSAQIKVIMDLSKPLPKELEIEREDDGVVPNRTSSCEAQQSGNGATVSTLFDTSHPKETTLSKGIVIRVNLLYLVSRKVQLWYLGLSQSLERMVGVTYLQRMLLLNLPKKSVISSSGKGSCNENRINDVASPVSKMHNSPPKLELKCVNQFEFLSQDGEKMESDKQLAIIAQPSPPSTQSLAIVSITPHKKKRKRILSGSPTSGDGFPLHRPLTNWIKSKPVSFGALLETHVRKSNINHILSSIGPEWLSISNYQHSDLDKIWIIYKAPTKVKHLFSDLQSITVE